MTNEDRTSGTGSVALDRLAVACVVLAVLPVIVAVIRAIQRDWIPLGEDALYALRARDVFTRNIPLLGTAASGSVVGGNGTNQPGPLYFDLLAVPVKLFGDGPGVAVGVGLVNIAAIVGVATFAFRRGGPPFTAAAMVVTSILTWTMGSEMLFDPWNPHAALLPFLLLLVCVWSMSCGDVVALPVAVVAASLVLQLHLSYVLMVPALMVWGLVMLGLGLRRRPRDRSDRPVKRDAVKRTAVVSAVLLAVCWAQPVAEQLAHGRDGNLLALLNRGDTTAQTAGVALGVQIVATVTSLPPWWFRPSFGESLLYIDGWRPPPLWASVVSLVIVTAALTWCARRAHRLGDRTAQRLIATAAVALVIGLATAAQGPISPAPLLRVTPHVYRWLWPIAAFASLVPLAMLMGWAFQRRWQPKHAVAAFTGLTALVAVHNLPMSNVSGSGTPNARQDAIPALRGLKAKMGVLEGQGTLLVDGVYRLGFADPWSGAVVAELRRRDIQFVAEDPVLVRQFGPRRRFDGHNASAALTIALGAGPVAPPGARRVAFQSGLSSTQARELSRLDRRIAAHLEASEALNPRGRAALADGVLPVLRAQLDAGRIDVAGLDADGELRKLVEADLLSLPDTWDGPIERYSRLLVLRNNLSVALFLSPIGPEQGDAGGN